MEMKTLPTKLKAPVSEHHEITPNLGGSVEADNVGVSASEKRLLRKVDLLFIPIVTLVTLVNQLDKGAIGNARILGMQKDVNMSNEQYYNAVSLYYVGFVVCTIPANLSLRFLKANRQIGGCVILFATFTACIAAAQNAATVLALRILFGFATPFFQALAVYLSLWYKRDEVALRNGVILAFSVLAGAFSGFISYAAALNLDGAHGYASWRWIFIIEGSCGIAIGIAAWLILPPPPDQIKNKKHWFLTRDEIDIAIERLRTYNVEGAGFKLKQMWPALKDPKTIAFALINGGVAPVIASVSAFLPSFIAEFGYSPANTQLMSVIPYACAFFSFLVLCYFSDRLNCKGPFLMFCMTLTSVGYIILICSHNIPVKIFATCLVVSGAFPSLALLGAWAVTNTGGFTKRATTWGCVEVVGQCISIGASHVYTDPPQYVKGHSTLLALQVMAFGCATANWLWMKRQNRLRDEDARHYAEAGTRHPDAGKTFEDLQDFHPDFRYVP